MLAGTQQPLAMLTERALRLLLAELGPVDTARFLNQYTLGESDAVVDKDSVGRVADGGGDCRSNLPGAGGG